MDLPDYGQWVIAKNAFGPKPPFVGVTVSFVRNAGTVHSLLQTAELSHVVRLGPDRFAARYSIGSHEGKLDAVFEDDRTLSVKLIGTVNYQYKAAPARLVTAGREEGE